MKYICFFSILIFVFNVQGMDKGPQEHLNATLVRKEFGDVHFIGHYESGQRARYKCEVCKKFYFNAALHAYIHTKKKSYSCDLCNQGFYQKAHLQRHRDSKKHQLAICNWHQRINKIPLESAQDELVAHP